MRGGSGAGADLRASTQKIACDPQRVEEYGGLGEVLLRDCVRGEGGGQRAADNVCCKRVEKRGDHGGGGGKRDIEDCERGLNGNCRRRDRAHLRTWLEEAARDEEGGGSSHAMVQNSVLNTSIGERAMCIRKENQRQKLSTVKAHLASYCI
jgi:hypothetical protein